MSLASPSRRTRVLLVLAIALGWGLLFGPSLLDHIETTRNPSILNDDVRQWIWPLFRLNDGVLFANDYVADYYLDALMPVGYKALYFLTGLVSDAATVSRLLPYLLLALVVVGVAAAGGALGGLATAFGSGALVLSSSLLLEKMVGGLPRAFGFPVMALTLYAMVSGRVWLLALSTVLGAAFYPTACVMSGLALALWLLVLPARDRARAATWALPRRLALLAATALASFALALPPVLGARSYGHRIDPTDVVTYPEMGPHGRYSREDRPPYRDFVHDGSKYLRDSLRGGGPPLVEGLRAADPTTAASLLLGLAGVGWTALAARSAAARRLLLLLLAVISSHVLARLFAPHLLLPTRYAVYGLPLIAFSVLPAAGAALASSLFRARAAAATGALAVTAACLLLVSGTVHPGAGYRVIIPAESTVYDFLKGIEEDDVVAGLPGGVIENVPFLSRRSALLTLENHNTHHSGFTEVMRQRVRGLFSALYASEPGPVLRLRDDFQVRYLVLDRADYRNRAPAYFAPFDRWVDDVHLRGRRKGFILPTLWEEAAVFSQGRILVVDLQMLPARSPASPPPE